MADPKDPQQELEAGEEILTLPEADEAEIEAGEDTDVAPVVNGASGSSDTLTALQGIISRQSSRLDSLRDQVSKLSESANSIIENDVELTEAQEAMKATATKVKERKGALAASPESMQLKYKLKEVKEQIKDIEESLNSHLLNYYQITGVKVFDTPEGGQREFVIKAKLLGKKAKQS